MKFNVKLSVLLTVAGILQAVTAGAQESFTISSAKFVTPLAEKWVAEYSKINPGMQIRIANGKETAVDVNISVFNGESDSEAQTVARYAILPITGKNNSLLSDLRKKKLNGKRLKELYFEKSILDDDYEPEKEDRYQATVYAGCHQHSCCRAFASHFGFEPNALKGKKIAGDDIFLNHAIAKDNSGVSFNNLNYVFDLQSRRLKDDIAILPLDLKKEYSEILAESDLDKTLELLEEKKIDLIPIEELRFETASADNAEIQKFLQWVRTEGQAFNHQFGLLKAEDRNLAQR
jgi:ABC-type phosphate transport system substrate-binding protein